MRYTIGVTMSDKAKSGQETEKRGIYSCGFMNLSFILTISDIRKGTRHVKNAAIPVFDSPQDAALFARILSRIQSEADRKRKAHGASIRYYPLKVDTKEFPYEVGIRRCRMDMYHDEHGNRHEDVYFPYDIYQVSLKSAWQETGNPVHADSVHN